MGRFAGVCRSVTYLRAHTHTRTHVRILTRSPTRHTHTHRTHHTSHTRARSPTCTHTYPPAHMHTHLPTRPHTNTHSNTHTRTHTRNRSHKKTHTHTYAPAHAETHTHTRTHTGHTAKHHPLCAGERHCGPVPVHRRCRGGQGRQDVLHGRHGLGHRAGRPRCVCVDIWFTINLERSSSRTLTASSNSHASCVAGGSWKA